MSEESVLGTLVDAVDLLKKQRDYLDKVLETRLEEATEDSRKRFSKWLKDEYNVTIEELEEQMDEDWTIWKSDFYPMFRGLAWFSFDDRIPEEYHNISSEQTIIEEDK